MLLPSVPSPSHTSPGLTAFPKASLGTVVPSLATASPLPHTSHLGLHRRPPPCSCPWMDAQPTPTPPV